MFGGEKGDDLLPMIEDMIAAGKEVRPEHVEPELWLASSALIDLFWELNDWRESSGMGPARLGLNLIDRYCHHYKFMIKSFEVTAIKLVDLVYLSHYKARTE